MGAGETQLLAQKIRQIEPRKNVRINALAIHCERDRYRSGHAAVPALKFWTAKQLRDASRHQLTRKVTAHAGGCLLILLRIKLVIEGGLRLRQHR